MRPMQHAATPMHGPQGGAHAPRAPAPQPAASAARHAGIDNRMRRKFKGTAPMPNVGYGTNNKTKHMLPSGFLKMVVSNVADVELLMMHNRRVAEARDRTPACMHGRMQSAAAAHGRTRRSQPAAHARGPCARACSGAGTTRGMHALSSLKQAASARTASQAQHSQCPASAAAQQQMRAARSDANTALILQHAAARRGGTTRPCLRPCCPHGGLALHTHGAVGRRVALLPPNLPQEVRCGGGPQRVCPQAQGHPGARPPAERERHQPQGAPPQPGERVKQGSAGGARGGRGGARVAAGCCVFCNVARMTS